MHRVVHGESPVDGDRGPHRPEPPHDPSLRRADVHQHPDPRRAAPGGSQPADIGVLVVVADAAGPGQTAPDWVAHWCRRAQWDLWPHPERGPAAAAAAARLEARVLVLRPDPGTDRPGVRAAGAAPQDRLGERRAPASSPLPEGRDRAAPQDRLGERRAPASSPLPEGRDRAAPQDRLGERRAPVSSPRIVAAVRRLPDDALVVADAAACAALLNGRLTIVHAVPRSFAERSVGLDGAVAHGRRLLDAAASRAAAHEPGVVVDCELLRVRPYELVGEALHADLLVVGGPRAARHGGGRPAGSEPGLVAHSALYHAPCPVLLTPR